MNLWKDLFALMPELFLGLTLVLILFGEITHHGEKLRLTPVTALLGLGSALIQTLLFYPTQVLDLFQHTLTVDGITFFFRLFFIVAALLAVIAAKFSREIPTAQRTEYVILVLASTLGLTLLSSASNILLILVCLVFINLLGYLIAGFNKYSASSNEAGIKYLMFSTVAMGMLAFGFAILFAWGHDLNLHEIHQALRDNAGATQSLHVAFVLIFLGLAFQVASVPMHFWAPDVIEGGPTPGVGYFSAVGRAAGFVVAIRVLLGIFAASTDSASTWKEIPGLNWAFLVATLSAVTMLVGGFLAIRQVSAKRLVACLLVAESGLLWVGLLVLDGVGIAALLYNLVVQLFAVIGVFFVLAFLVDELGTDHLDQLRGTMRRAVPETIFLLLFMFCIVGIPPMTGFVGKFTIIGAALRRQWTLLAAVAIITIALSTVATIKLAFNLAGDFKDYKGAAIERDSWRIGFLFLLLLPVLLAGIFAQQILGWAVRTTGFILW